MATLEEILSEQRHLTEKLYGINGFEGDIPEIKELIKKQCAKQTETDKRLTRWIGNVKLLVGILIGSGVLGGSIIGVDKLLGG